MPLLEIKNLSVSTDQKKIISDLSLSIKPREIHAIMGPNGSGKSTLAQILMGNPKYNVDQGEIIFNGKSVTTMKPEERAKAGIFLAFQYPVTIPGLNIAQYLRLIFAKQTDQKISPVEFREMVSKKIALLDINPEFLDRNLNEDFSGGEKKKLEILQLILLQPKLIILDEIDSGLDIDALKNVADAILKNKSKNASLLIITHYNRILDYIKPNHVHVMKNGAITQSDGPALAAELEKVGYTQ